jgi:hypothetical protein
MLILNKFASGLKTKFRSLQQSKQWTGGVSKPGAFFKAAGAPSCHAQPKQLSSLPEGWTHPNSEWQSWFDRQLCDICKKHHPTKYHYDPERRNRPFKISDAKGGKPNRKIGDSKRNDPPCNKLKLKRGQKEEFKKRVYNLFECLDKVDDESSKNSDQEQHVNIADALMAAMTNLPIQWR